MTFLQNDIFTQNAYIIKSTKYTIKVGVRKMKKLMTPAIVIFVLVLILPSISAAFSGQQEPNKPTLTGPTEVKRYIKYTYRAVTTDPQGDAIFYRFQFYYNSNDNYITDWLGPYSSGAEASFVYTWHDIGVYQVGAQAKDTSEHTSEWASLDVTVHKLLDSSESSIPQESLTTIFSSITVTIIQSGVIVQQSTYPLYLNLMNQQQQNP
jgi:hypothetical protein